MSQKLRNTDARRPYELADGTRVPGATTITGLLNKPALIKWANRMGLEGVDTTKYVDRAASIGTVAHRLVQADWQGEDYNAVRESLAEEHGEETLSYAENSALSYFAWAKHLPLRPLWAERPLVSEAHRFGGTLDLLASIGGDTVIVDLKTGSGIYPEHVIQVSAYRQLVEEVLALKVEQAVILNIPRRESESFQSKQLLPAQMDVAWQVFWHLRQVYDLKKRVSA